MLILCWRKQGSLASADTSSMPTCTCNSGMKNWSMVVLATDDRLAQLVLKQKNSMQTKKQQHVVITHPTMPTNCHVCCKRRYDHWCACCLKPVFGARHCEFFVVAVHFVVETVTALHVTNNAWGWRGNPSTNALDPSRATCLPANGQCRRAWDKSNNMWV